MLKEIRITDERMKNSITEKNKTIHIPNDVSSPILQYI